MLGNLHLETTVTPLCDEAVVLAQFLHPAIPDSRPLCESFDEKLHCCTTKVIGAKDGDQAFRLILKPRRSAVRLLSP